MIENYYISKNAEIVQLVERDLPKVDVEGSSPFFRSKIRDPLLWVSYFIFAERTRTREEGSLTKVPNLLLYTM